MTAPSSRNAACLQRDAVRCDAKIESSAPHALHMPSHIFTPLGLWEDSIASNVAARYAALAQPDVGEALHAMDYLTSTYLQRGRVADAAREVAALKAMTLPPGPGFKIGYAANAMPVRLAIETRDWRPVRSLARSSAPPRKSLRSCGELARWETYAPLPRGSADADIVELQGCRRNQRRSRLHPPPKSLNFSLRCVEQG